MEERVDEKVFNNFECNFFLKFLQLWKYLNYDIEVF